MPATPVTPIINQNYLQSIGFNVIIDRLPTVSYFATSVNVAGIETSNTRMGTPFAAIPLPSDHPRFGAFSLEFIVDEDLRNWEELMTWLVGISFPESHDQWKTLVGTSKGAFKAGKENNIYSDITIQTLTSAKNPKMEITYHNAIPNGIQGFVLTATGKDTDIITSTVGFDYSHFTIKRLN